MRLATERLSLRELVEDDWRAVLAIETPEVVRYMFQDAATEASARAYVQGTLASAAELPRQVFELAITRTGDDTMLGRCGLKREADARLASMWFCLHPDHHGRGYVTEAMAALLAYGFDELGLHRVWGDCDPQNLASARVMDKLGMRREAIHLENVWVKGAWCGTQIFALLAREWASR